MPSHRARGARVLALALAALVFVMAATVPARAAGRAEPSVPAGGHPCGHI